MPTFRPLRSLLAAALAVAATPALATESFTQFSNTVFFGDSLTDSGFYQPILVAQFGTNAGVAAKFTTNPGLVWAEYLADYYGTNATPAWQLTTTGIAQGTGSDYAAGGATVGQGAGFPPTPPTQFAPSLTDQVGAYLAANGGAADPNALYSVWGGANDLFFFLNGATTQAQFLGAAGTEAQLIGALQDAGARYVLVPTMPDVGQTPFGLSQGAAGSAGITQLVDAYNATLFGTLAADGLRVIPLDTYDLLHEITADPGTYGFTNVTTPACGTAASLGCTAANFVDPNAASTYVFADGVHPTTAAHQVLAQYAISILEAPNQMAVLPHSEAVIGRARAERIAANAASRPADEAVRWWGTVNGDFQRYGKGDLYDGSGATLDVGFDMRSGGLVYGGFAGWGRQNLDWGRRKGDFSQDDGTLGGFVGWHGENGWVDGQVSYSWLGFDTSRQVVLGAATRTHEGSADGSNVSAGVSGGWMFHNGNWHNGPVGSLLWQRIDVDGFSESDPTLSTSLAYPDQQFRSLIGSLGWQLSYTPSDRIQPYARVTWDHEFHDMEDEAFAQVQSLPGTLPYAVPGLQFDRNYGTLLLGARTNVLGLEANFGASTTFAQETGDDASVFLTLGRGF